MTSLQQGNARTNALLIVAKANDLDIELVETKPGDGVSDDYRKLNRLGKIPTFEGADNYVLSEVIAIAVYRKLLSDFFRSFRRLCTMMLYFIF